MTTTIGDMKVPEDVAKRMLADVRRNATALERARTKRDEAIRAAMDAGIPRQQIADAARLHRVHLYEIAKSDTPD